MKIWYDCEFLDDGRAIDLVSIGMVAEDGRELCAVSEDVAKEPLYSRICGHEWLMENVVPHLPLRAGGGQRLHGALVSNPRKGFFNLDLGSNVVMPRRMIRNAVRDFILATPDVELWAWYGAYDHVCLAQLFGRMIDLPAGVPMWTNDLKQECQRLGNPKLPKQEAGKHDALADARWNRQMHLHLESLAAVR